MTAHHLICEEDVIQNCLYCGTEFDPKKWNSKWIVNRHYKQITCECGKRHDMTVDFVGSGHDSWVKKVCKKVKSLEGLEEKVKNEADK